jgi:hypothetical protein
MLPCRIYGTVLYCEWVYTLFCTLFLPEENGERNFHNFRGRPVEVLALSDRMCVLRLYIKIVLSNFGLQCTGLVLCKPFTVPSVTDLNFLYCPYIP